ncbi:hypothetical protein RLOC_00006213 [Lonchura striata]|uniref:Uncharacterized protein n=1 Tax=Lonchura striata TaxID=40157 RepID=A0A218V2R1_9PASE|nr:hypothetical protein RLOC_00006213 [Lonchura striata domestica]
MQLLSKAESTSKHNDSSISCCPSSWKSVKLFKGSTFCQSSKYTKFTSCFLQLEEGCHMSE